MNRRIGYARGSFPGKFLDLQISELKAAGCNTIYTDKISGTRMERPGLNQCLKSLRAGDTLMVWRMDRLGRSTSYLMSFIRALRQRNIKIHSLKKRNKRQ